MASATAVSSSLSSTTARRHHYQPQLLNTSGSVNQGFTTGETTNVNESFSLPTMPANPLITIIYSNTSLTQDNQQLLLNSYASCRRLLDHMKQIVGIHHDEMIDLMDNEGKLKELSTHFDDYATQFLTARSTYYVLKVEIDNVSGEKRYTPNFNIDQIDQKLSSTLTNSLNTLNKSVKNPIKRATTTTRQNTTVQSSSHTTQAKTKRTSARKPN